MKISNIKYTPWEEVRPTPATTNLSSSLTRFTFTGQCSYMDDPSTSGVTEGFGLMHYGARMYDPKLGRFLSADSLVPNTANPQDFNRYSYVRNNPVRYTDPTGHMCTDPEDPNPTCEGSSVVKTRVGNKMVSGSGRGGFGGVTTPVKPKTGGAGAGGYTPTPTEAPTVTPTTPPASTPTVISTTTPTITPDVSPTVLPTPTITSTGTPCLNGGDDCNTAELVVGASLILGAEAIAIGLAVWAGSVSGPVGFVETLELANTLFTPAFLAGAALIVDSGCVFDIPSPIEIE